MKKKYYNVYISTNYPRCTVFYTGVTNNVFARSEQHKNKTNKKSFTAKYNINRIVYYETFNDIEDAIEREKQIKAGSRKKKIELIKSMNQKFEDMIERSWE